MKKKKCIAIVMTIVIIWNSAMAQTKVEEPVLPDFNRYRLSEYDENFFGKKVVCGERALEYWMQSANWRLNPAGKPEKNTKLERLLSDDPVQVSLVNKELRKECHLVLTDVHAWLKAHPQSRSVMVWIQLALRVPEKLEPGTHEIIRKTLKAIDLSGEGCNYIGWLTTPGSNGSNVHGYLTPLTLGPALIDDPKTVKAGEKGLLGELKHMNNTGDMGEFNVLESHWNGTSSWELIKKYTPDPNHRRIARLISERLWINRFMTWSSEVERITGPGSRMAPSEWLGTDNERALLATGLSKPIWLDFFFPWEVWDPRKFQLNFVQTQIEATIPDLPTYLQDLAWRKTFPNEMQARVALKHWKPYPPLDDTSPGDALRPAKYVNYQTAKYSLGSTTSSWVVNTCVVGASAWWNNSRNTDATVGSPERFCVLYPHYVFNGMSFMDKGDLFFQNKPDQPVEDAKGGPGGPWMREFIDFGRVGTLQDRNTLILSYTPKAGTHHAGQDLVKTKTNRASAAMYLFRWTEGTEGLFVNRKPVTTLPYELQPGDWWFIEDGDVYAGVRPLKATALKGDCKTVLEARTRHIVLYQDNVNAGDINGISDKEWVQAQSGFIVEMGDKKEYGSFSNFQDKILNGKVSIDVADGYNRHITYERQGRQLEMKWHSYKEEYASRQISDEQDPWIPYLQSPEFSVNDSGTVKVQDAILKTTAGNTQWLLSCPPSKTWVAYQSQFNKELPVELICPIGRFYTQRLPFGKVVVQKENNIIKINIDGGYRSSEGTNEKEGYALYFEGTDQTPEVTINGAQYTPKKSGQKWVIDPYENI